MLSIYGTIASRTFRVVWAARELGIPHDLVETGFMDGSTWSPEFLEINPNGRVPAILDHENAMFESFAINLHLAFSYVGTLGPRDDRERALMLQWSFWAANELERAVMVILLNRRSFAPEECDEAEVSLMVGKLHRPLCVLEKALRQGRFVLGDRFTIADLNIASVLALARTSDFAFTHYPTVQRWLEDVLARPHAAGHEALPPRLARPDNLLGLLI